jgi:hypothetical protein
MSVSASGAANKTALEAALASSLAVGKPVGIAPGTYIVATGIQITEPVHIVGSGRRSTVLNFDGWGDAITISGQERDYSSISHLSLTGTATAAGSRGIVISRRTILDQIYVRGFDSHNIELVTVDVDWETPYFSLLHYVISEGSRSGSGILVGPTGGVNLELCESWHNQDHGLLMQGSWACNIIGGHYSYNGKNGIRFLDVKRHTINGVFSEGNNYMGNGGGTTDPLTGQPHKGVLFNANCWEFAGHLGDIDDGLDCLTQENMPLLAFGYPVNNRFDIGMRPIVFGDDGASAFVVRGGNHANRQFNGSLDFVGLGGASRYNFQLGGNNIFSPDVGGDVHVWTPGRGVIVRSPNGTAHRLWVNDSGNVVASPV